MKKLQFNRVSFAVVLVFAGMISCSEQDEIRVVPDPSSSSRSSSSNGSLNWSGKDRSSGRVGGELFHSQVGGALDLATAKQWTVNYRQKNPDEIRSHFFGFEIIQQILGEAGCVGIRIMYAIDENGEKKLLLVGVDAEGNNLLPSDGEMMMMMEGGGEENTIADYSFPCPNHCPPEGEEDL